MELRLILFLKEAGRQIPRKNGSFEQRALLLGKQLILAAQCMEQMVNWLYGSLVRFKFLNNFNI